MPVLANRMIRASKLDVNLYEEVEGDKNAFRQAMLVVVISSVAAGIGSIATGGIIGIISGTLAALVGWFIWAYLTYLIGTKLLPEAQTKSNPGELLRTLGFAAAPGTIRILGLIPFLRDIAFFIASVWMLLTMVIGIRQALDYKSTLRAVGVALIGWLIQLLIMGIFLFAFVSPALQV